MASIPDSSQYWPDIPYDFSRYLYIKNKFSKIENLLQHIYKGAAFRIFKGTDERGWKWIVIKYPNKTVALREAIKLHDIQMRERSFRIDPASHELAFLVKLEKESDNFFGERTTALIINFPERISLEQWKKFLSKFAKRVVISKTITTKKRPALRISCETLAEVAAITLALHSHEIDGKKLYIKLLKKEKERHLIALYKKSYEKCQCLVSRCTLHRPVSFRKGSTFYKGKPLKKRKLPNPSIFCSFCRYPGIHPIMRDYVEQDANTRDIPWDEEFAELEEIKTDVKNRQKSD